MGRKRIYAAYYRETTKLERARHKRKIKAWCKKEGVSPKEYHDFWGFRNLFRDAEAGEFNTLLIYSFDSIHSSAYAIINFMLSLERHGIKLIVVTDQDFNSSSRHRGWVEKAIEVERNLLSERTKAGMAKAKAAGKRVGRKPGSYATKYELVKKMRREGKTYVAIAHAVQLSVSHVYYHLNPDKRKTATTLPSSKKRA